MSFPLTIEHVVAGDVPRRLAELFCPNLNAAMQEFDIVTGDRPSMFLAQVCHESGGLRYTAEIWGPTPQQLRYDDGGSLARSLGNVSGEGFQWRGHGLIQITGYLNHKAAAYQFGKDITEIASWLQTPEGASRSAAHWWRQHGCNEIADSGDFTRLTRRINGGLNGLVDRVRRHGKIEASMQHAIP